MAAEGHIPIGHDAVAENAFVVNGERIGLVDWLGHCLVDSERTRRWVHAESKLSDLALALVQHHQSVIASAALLRLGQCSDVRRPASNKNEHLAICNRLTVAVVNRVDVEDKVVDLTVAIAVDDRGAPFKGEPVLSLDRVAVVGVGAGSRP